MDRLVELSKDKKELREILYDVRSDAGTIRELLYFIAKLLIDIKFNTKD